MNARLSEHELDAIQAERKAWEAEQAQLLAHWSSQSAGPPSVPELDLADAMRQDHDEMAPKPATCVRPMFDKCPAASRAIGWMLFIGFIAAVGFGLN